jgi:deazaflavin-dependent oxidoreductase (nitroreductase family)
VKFWLSIGNVFVKLILRSPLHGLLSKNTLLIAVTGRRSGRQYTTPVNYVRDGERITVISQMERTWWKNLRGGAQVTVLLRGQTLTGTATAITNDDRPIADDLVAYYEELIPGRFSPEEVAGHAPQTVLIQIRLASSGT